jgi:hypothetical protein
VHDDGGGGRIAKGVWGPGAMAWKVTGKKIMMLCSFGGCWLLRVVLRISQQSSLLVVVVIDENLKWLRTSIFEFS